jgi:hypothetical protein
MHLGDASETFNFSDSKVHKRVDGRGISVWQDEAQLAGR